MIVCKRDGTIVDYNPMKIVNAIEKANKEVPENERISKSDRNQIIDIIQQEIRNGVQKGLENRITVEAIQNIIERELVNRFGKYQLAKAYILYRYQRELVRKANTTDESILSLLKTENKDLMEENSNKNAYISSTQRDLIAGEVSKDISKRILLPKDVTEAHENGVLHFHDMDYFIQNIFNCCLINIGDMLDNGTVMNGKMIESPKSFQVACTVTTQIIAAVASSQYGGQSVNIKHLGKYLKKSYDKYKKKVKKELGENLLDTVYETKEAYDDCVERIVHDRLKDELSAGIQTIQYQINTLMTTNGWFFGCSKTA